ncbi:trypsin-like peptidase domain-containing protein [Cellulomonas cellasea]|uniref:S1C family serine protease n=1 Tax=Cellulomonas cellasea TaxID=43670 RepID=UPI0025A3A509|nr:trypsin-like peptidase domain-containing protein [Cellulomonas cellasea]MDM8085527.1 trypsin-like peptidase domain-containing protein [Cellulomonas cellasea]
MSTPDDPRSAQPDQPQQPAQPVEPDAHSGAEPHHPAEQHHPAEPQRPADQQRPAEPQRPADQQRPAEQQRPADQQRPAEPRDADTQVLRPTAQQGQPGHQGQQPSHPTNPFQPPHPAAPTAHGAQGGWSGGAGGPGQAHPPAGEGPGQRGGYGGPGHPGGPGQSGGPDQPGGPGYPGGPGPGQPGGPGGPGGQPPRRRSIWGPLVGVAIAAALLASIVTAGLMALVLRDDNGSSSSLATIGQGSSESPSAPVEGSSVENPDWERVASAVQASVVAIAVQTSSGAGQGSGVIIDDDGNILTNDHVVGDAVDNGIEVTLTDGRLFQAEVVGTDSATDLAVIRLLDAPDDLDPATLGNSADVKVGEAVMAVGNPLGLSNTVTTGIVSAVDRPVSTSESGGEAVTNAIQIDAAINPGNSGGPLFDGQGLVIGITSSIATLSSESGSIGLGFAIPVNLAKQIGTQLIDSGSAEHAFLGVSMTDGTATADGVTRRGAVVQAVTDGSPAAEAGVQPGDVIVAIDDKPVAGAESLTAYVRELTSGSKVTLTLVRDGQTKDVEATLATRQETSTSAPTTPTPGSTTQPGQERNGSDVTPEQLWEWFQQQQQQQQQQNGN